MKRLWIACGALVIYTRCGFGAQDNRPGELKMKTGNEMQPGIYELNGKTLRLCFAAPGRERPGDFASTPGDGRTFTVWIKVQK